MHINGFRDVLVLGHYNELACSVHIGEYWFCYSARSVNLKKRKKNSTNISSIYGTVSIVFQTLMLSIHMVPLAKRSSFHYTTTKNLDPSRAWWEIQIKQYININGLVPHLDMATSALTGPMTTETRIQTSAKITLLQIMYKRRKPSWLGRKNSTPMKLKCFISINVKTTTKTTKNPAYQSCLFTAGHPVRLRHFSFIYLTIRLRARGFY